MNRHIRTSSISSNTARSWVDVMVTMAADLIGCMFCFPSYPLRRLGLTDRRGHRIVRPGFFMENFDGLMGAIALTVFREGLTEDAAVPMIVGSH